MIDVKVEMFEALVKEELAPTIVHLSSASSPLSMLYSCFPHRRTALLETPLRCSRSRTVVCRFRCCADALQSEMTSIQNMT